MQSDFKYIAEDIRRQIDGSLAAVGILFRAFARGKDKKSIEEKIRREPGKYQVDGKMIQDIIGVRIALYFREDIPIVQDILCSKYSIDSTASAIDKPDSDQFSVTRHNLVFKLPRDDEDNFRRISGSNPFDSTFEVQIRSILSEGWHEVEHDLRYKAKDNWQNHDDLSRTLNGIVATLETAEWSMGKVFDELAYRHYREKNWPGMLSSLLKMRVKNTISNELIAILDTHPSAAKDLLRIKRPKLIMALSECRPRIPITMENLVYVWNAIGPKHEQILELTPDIIMEATQ
ncbi:MAG: hypothetical protein GX049_06095 [Alcaligenaceae bacterium]|nr:hypothetical protein [Alcaligenaceae bacterium]